MVTTKIIVEGTDATDPFQGLKKLLGGFCDPGKSQQEARAVGTDYPKSDFTKSSAASTASTSRTISAQSEEPGLTVEQEKPATTKKTLVTKIPKTLETSEKSEEDTFSSEEVEPEEKQAEPELKATNITRKHRVQRGLGVAIVGLLAVFTTLLTLHRVGYVTFTVDVPTEGTASKPLINIQYNEEKAETESIPARIEVEIEEEETEEEETEPEIAEEL